MFLKGLWNVLLVDQGCNFVLFIPNFSLWSRRIDIIYQGLKLPTARRGNQVNLILRTEWLWCRSKWCAEVFKRIKAGYMRMSSTGRSVKFQVLILASWLLRSWENTRTMYLSDIFLKTFEHRKHHSRGAIVMNGLVVRNIRRDSNQIF